MFRFSLLCAALVIFAIPQFTRAGDPDPEAVRIFEVTGGGKVQHIHGNQLGDKTFVTKVNKKSIDACINDDFQGPDCAQLQGNKDGKVFLYIFTSTSWGIATSSDPGTAEITMMEGLTDGKGKFMFVGTDADTGVTFIAEGKAKLDKDFGNDLIPKKVSGKLRALDTVDGHTGVSSIKTVGKPLAIEM